MESASKANGSTITPSEETIRLSDGTDVVVRSGPASQESGPPGQEFDITKRVVGPTDPSFFRTLRVKLGDNPLSNPYRQHPWMHSGVRRIATNISAVPFRIMRDAGLPPVPNAFADLRKQYPMVPPWVPDVHSLAYAKRRTRGVRSARQAFVNEVRAHAPQVPLAILARATGTEVVEDGPWVDLFRDVNPSMTRSQLWESTVVYLHVDGEAFWIPQNSAGNPIVGSEVPKEIWVRPKKGFEPQFDKNNALSGWVYSFKDQKGDQKKQRFSNGQALQFRFFDPHNQIRGLGAYEPMKLDVETDHKAALYNKSFLEGGALPGGVLTTDKPLTPSQVKEVVDEWELRHKGAAKGHRPAVLWGGMKFDKAGITHKDMEFLQLREWTRDAVMAVLGVPKSELGLIQDVNRATALVSKRGFWNDTLIPIAKYIEDLTLSDLFTPITDGKVWGVFDLSVVQSLRQELGEKLESALLLFQMGYPPNMINDRLEIGMDSVPWGDTGFLRDRLSKIGTIGEPFDPGDSGSEEDDGDPFGDSTTDNQKNKGEQDDKPDDDGPNADSLVVSPRWLSLERDVLIPGEKKFLGRYNKFLFELGGETLKKLNDTDLNLVVMADQLLPRLEPAQSRLMKLVEPAYLNILDLARKDVTREIDEMFGAVRATEDDPDIKFLLNTMGTRIKKTVNTIRNTLRKTLAEGIEAQDAKEGLLKRIRTAFATFKNKAKIIARTETGSAINAIREDAFTKRRISMVAWVTSGDELVRQNHVVYGMGGDQPKGFNWATLSGNSYTLRRPHDFGAPIEETMNCRCVLAPALPK